MQNGGRRSGTIQRAHRHAGFVSFVNSILFARDRGAYSTNLAIVNFSCNAIVECTSSPDVNPKYKFTEPSYVQVCPTFLRRFEIQRSVGLHRCTRETVKVSARQDGVHWPTGDAECDRVAPLYSGFPLYQRLPFPWALGLEYIQSVHSVL